MSGSSSPATAISLSCPPRTKHKYLIFFLPGNPGVIEYYRTFLAHLHALLSSEKSPSILKYECDVQIVGETLAGFECGNNLPRIKKEEKLPFCVEEQILFTERLLLDHVKCLSEESEDDVEWKVILIGHSFGSYVLLEIIRRLRQRLRSEKVGNESRMRILGGICLFPGILGLAKSSRARTIMVGV
jgi:hypothetical protein